MYYNIKIKSHGSEFSLESNNKEVTQREMDIYFACIFDVSEEFKSNIKKIEIKNTNVKSIDEIENYTKNADLQNIANPKPIQQQLYKPQLQPQTTKQISTPQPQQINPSVYNQNAHFQNAQQQIIERNIQPQHFNQPQAQQPKIEMQRMQNSVQNFAPKPNNLNFNQNINNEIPKTPYQNQATTQNLDNITYQNTKIPASQEPSKADIENFLGKVIETTPNLKNTTPNETIQITPTLERYIESVEMPLPSTIKVQEDEIPQQLKEVYIPQKEVLEIKFDNVANMQYNQTEPQHNYDDLSIKDFNLELEEMPLSSENLIEKPNASLNISANTQEIQYQEPSCSQDEQQRVAFVEPVFKEPTFKEPVFDTVDFQKDSQEKDTITQDTAIKEAEVQPEIQSETQPIVQPQVAVEFIKQDEVEINSTPQSNFSTDELQEIKYKEEKEEPKTNEIDELINLAQNKIDSFDISTNTTAQTKNANHLNNNNSPYETVDFDLSNTKYENFTSYSQAQSEIDKNKTNQNNQEKIDTIFSKTDTQHQIQQTSSQKEVEYEYIELTQEEKEKLLNNAAQINKQPQTNTEAQPQQEQQPQQMGSYQQDFKLFLNEFNCNNTTETFLVCAFYIKNILKQENFTMKFINSKLFQATGNIADLAVLDDLVSKEYIRVIDSIDSKKYSITQDGEGYFTRRFQG